MILSNLKTWRNNSELISLSNPRLIKALEWLETTNLDGLPPGKHQIEGDAIFGIVSRGQTAPDETAQFEAHRRYIDIQLMIAGVESIGVALTDSLTVAEPYNDERDIVFFRNPPDFRRIPILSGDFLVLMPNDAHLPTRPLKEPGEDFFKVVVKVLI